MNTETRAKSTQFLMEDLLLLMNASKVKRDAPHYGGYSLPIRHFDYAEPLTLPAVTHHDYDDMITAEATLADLENPLDITVAANVTDPSEAGEDFAVRRYRTVKKPRLPLRQRTRHIVEEARLFINRKTGEGTTSLRYYGTNTNVSICDAIQSTKSPWFDLQRGERMNRSVVQLREQYALGMAIGYQFGRDYHWHVHLKWPGAEAGLLFPTTPQGARELFRLRDCEPGKQRRSALRTWVSEHSRRIHRRDGEEDVTTVREHLRGATSFRWQDMEGVILPSAYDLRRVEEAKARAS